MEKERFDCYAENGLTGDGDQRLWRRSYKNGGEVQGVAGNSQQE